MITQGEILRGRCSAMWRDIANGSLPGLDRALCGSSPVESGAVSSAPRPVAAVDSPPVGAPLVLDRTELTFR